MSKPLPNARKACLTLRELEVRTGFSRSNVPEPRIAAVKTGDEKHLTTTSSDGMKTAEREDFRRAMV